jgi:dipeptidyl aminopeptidase/acylaminoacyl peptidase
MIDQRGTGRDAFYAIDAQSGAVSPLFSDNRYDVSGYQYDPWSQEIVGVSFTKDFSTQAFFEPDLEAVRQSVAESFKGGFSRIESWDQAREVFTVSGFTGVEPPAYYIYRKKEDTLTRIGQSYPELAQAPIGNRVTLTYKARDGVAIPAYLTVPEGGQPKGLPLILLPHGGPASRDDAGFDWMASFLASRGYAVLQPNFRGSSGYGVAWEHAGRGQWGGVMQNDLTDAVAALGRTGMIDPKRVCIAGASYGGYAALAGATLTPDLYRCAISVGGIADLDLLVAREQERSTQGGARRDAFKLTLGDLYSDAAKRRSVSPSHNAEKIQIPILLVHSALDSVVSADQSTRFRDRLTMLRKPVTYVELTEDDHWLSYAPTRIKTLEAMETFLAQHLPAR